MTLRSLCSLLGTLDAVFQNEKNKYDQLQLIYNHSTLFLLIRRGGNG